MQPVLPLLYFGGLAGAALTLRALARPQSGRRRCLYAAVSTAMLTAVVALGVAG